MKKKKIKGGKKNTSLKLPTNKNVHLDDISDSTSYKLLT